MPKRSYAEVLYRDESTQDELKELVNELIVKVKKCVDQENDQDKLNADYANKKESSESEKSNSTVIDIDGFPPHWLDEEDAEPEQVLMAIPVNQLNLREQIERDIRLMADFHNTEIRNLIQTLNAFVATTQVFESIRSIRTSLNVLYNRMTTEIRNTVAKEQRRFIFCLSKPANELQIGFSVSNLAEQLKNILDLINEGNNQNPFIVIFEDLPEIRQDFERQLGLVSLANLIADSSEDPSVLVGDASSSTQNSTEPSSEDEWSVSLELQLF